LAKDARKTVGVFGGRCAPGSMREATYIFFEHSSHNNNNKNNNNNNNSNDNHHHHHQAIGALSSLFVGLMPWFIDIHWGPEV
jgi:hypothetical protein